MDYTMDVSGYDSREWKNGGWAYDLPINWNAGRAIGLTCASMKAGEALGEDPAFAMNWKAAKGRPREAWWFFRQNISAIAQAHKFLSVIQDDWTDQDLATIDWETYDGVMSVPCYANGMTFLAEVKRELGKAGIYTYPAYWNGLGAHTQPDGLNYLLHMAQWPLDNWIANIPIWPYNFRLPKLQSMMSQIAAGTMKPMSLLPWGTNIMAWQFTARAWTADVPGHPAIKKVCDMNAILKPWWNTVVPPAPAPVPGPAYPSYRVVPGANPNVHTLPNSGSPILGYVLHDTVLYVDPAIITNGYGHFQPTVQFPAGGWVAMLYLKVL